MCYLTLTAVDQLHDYMAYPMVLWFAMAASGVFTSQHLLSCPLWLTRSFKVFTAFAFATSLPFAYRAFANQVNYNEYAQTFATLQMQIDRDRTSSMVQ